MAAHLIGSTTFFTPNMEIDCLCSWTMRFRLIRVHWCFRFRFILKRKKKNRKPWRKTRVCGLRDAWLSWPDDTERVRRTEFESFTLMAHIISIKRSTPCAQLRQTNAPCQRHSNDDRRDSQKSWRLHIFSSGPRLLKHSNHGLMTANVHRIKTCARQRLFNLSQLRARIQS